MRREYRPPYATGQRRSTARAKVHPDERRPPVTAALALRRLLLLRLQRGRVDAEALPGRRRTVLEDVAQVPAAAPADHFGAPHAVRGVGLGGHRALGDRRREAGPAGPGVELGLRREQLGAAAGTQIIGVLVGVPERAGKCPLGPLAPQDLVLLGRQRRAPLGVGLVHLIGHRARSISCYTRAALISDRVLITVTGPDRTGVTATLTGILAQQGATLYDIEQVVVQGQLTLCLVVGVPETRDVLKELLFAAKQLDMELNFKPVPAGAPSSPKVAEGRRFVITAIGPTLGAPHLHAIATALAAEGANIEKIGRLSENTLASVEIHAQLPADRDSEVLKRSLLAVATSAGFDVSLQPESLYRRSKRLVVLDMDSTLIRIEVIDELARAAGVGPEVSRITERAMQGEMDYDESLRQRVALLKGLDVAVLDRIAADLPLTEGAETMVRVLKRLGYKIAVISGGFSRAAEALKRRLG